MNGGGKPIRASRGKGVNRDDERGLYPLGDLAEQLGAFDAGLPENAGGDSGYLSEP